MKNPYGEYSDFLFRKRVAEFKTPALARKAYQLYDKEHVEAFNEWLGMCEKEGFEVSEGAW